jgi:hypothetical protein
MEQQSNSSFNIPPLPLPLPLPLPPSINYYHQIHHRRSLTCLLCA